MKNTVKNFLQLYTEAVESGSNDKEVHDAMASDTKIIIDDKPYSIAFKDNDDGSVCVIMDKKITWFKYDPTAFTATVIPPPDQITGDLRIKGVVSLEGCPKNIIGNFECTNCPGLKTLEGGPEFVGGFYNCCQNDDLISLVGVAKKINGDMNCHECDKLTSFKGLQDTEIGYDLICSHTENLQSPEGLPPPDKIGTIQKPDKVHSRGTKGRILCDTKLLDVLNSLETSLENAPDPGSKELLANVKGWLEKAEARSNKTATKPDNK
jgi:hypothetical protein